MQSRCSAGSAGGSSSRTRAVCFSTRHAPSWRAPGRRNSPCRRSPASSVAPSQFMRARPSRAIGCRRSWSAFAEAHPRVTINLVARNTTEVARAVQDGTADLGLVEGRVDANDLVQQAVARDRLALVVGPTHPWAWRRSIKGPYLLAAEWVLRE